MKPIRSMIPAALLAATLAVHAPAARAQAIFYGQGVTDYSYTGFGSAYGSYGYGGFGPWYANQGMVAGGMYGMPYGGMYATPYGGAYGVAPYGGVSVFPNNQMLPYGPMPMGNFGAFNGNGAGRVGGVVPYVPRLDMSVPRLSPNVPRLR